MVLLHVVDSQHHPFVHNRAYRAGCVLAIGVDEPAHVVPVPPQPVKSLSAVRLHPDCGGPFAGDGIKADSTPVAHAITETLLGMPHCSECSKWSWRLNSWRAARYLMVPIHKAEVLAGKPSGMARESRQRSCGWATRTLTGTQRSIAYISDCSPETDKSVEYRKSRIESLMDEAVDHADPAIPTGELVQRMGYGVALLVYPAMGPRHPSSLC